MMWIIHGYHPYPQEFIHHPRIFTWMHPDAKLYTPPPVPGRILPSPGGIPGFLVDSWRIPGIPGRFLVNSWRIPGIPGIPGGFLVNSWQLPGSFLGEFLADSWWIPGEFLVLPGTQINIK
jgi:hypothetical protein